MIFTGCRRRRMKLRLSNTTPVRRPMKELWIVSWRRPATVSDGGGTGLTSSTTVTPTATTRISGATTPGRIAITSSRRSTTISLMIASSASKLPVTSFGRVNRQG